MSVRRIGVEEEFMLVSPDTGRLMAVSQRALKAHRAAADRRSEDSSGQVEHELFLQQIETGTTPASTLTDLERELRRSRAAVGTAAAAAGARALAVGTPVLAGGDHHVTPSPRYQLIVDEFGEIGRQACVCGMHLHIDVVDETEAVAVVDQLRPWLPVLRALSVNSPFWLGRDSGYASWRTQVWSRWPTAGPAEPYRSVEGYRAATERLIATKAALDKGMLYLDARLSEHYPTVEIRVTDVCTETDDIVLIAALTRALVETAVENATEGAESPHRSDALRSAHWRAARFGLADRLVSPLSQQLEPARAVIDETFTFVREALDEYDDTERVADLLERLIARGSGASRQRAVRR